MTHTVGTRPDTAATDLKQAILAKLTYTIGKDPTRARGHDWYVATTLAVRDRVVDRWMATTREVYETGQKRVYYLSLEFLIGRLLDDAICNLGLTDACARRCASSASTSTRSRSSSPTPRSAMAASAGSPPASWRAWRRSACPPTATASATTTACSGRRSRTAGRSSCRRTGSTTATPGSSSAARSPTRSASAAGRVQRATATASATSGSRPSTCSPSPTTRRWSAGRARGSTRCACGRRAPIDPIRLDAFNRGDHIGGLRRRARADEHHPRALPRRLDAGRPGAAAAAGVLLRLGLAAGHRAPAPAAVRRPAQPARARSRSSSTTPTRRSPSPELMRLLIDVHGFGFDDAPGRSPAAPSPTPTTRCCPRRWRAGRCRCSSGCCRATCRSSTRSTQRLLRPARSLPGGARRARPRAVADRRAARAAGAHGPPRLRRLAQGQRRLGAAHRADEGDGLRGPPPRLPRPDHQQDQRHHARALAACRRTPS